MNYTSTKARQPNKKRSNPFLKKVGLNILSSRNKGTTNNQSSFKVKGLQTSSSPIIQIDGNKRKALSRKSVKEKLSEYEGTSSNRLLKTKIHKTTKDQFLKRHKRGFKGAVAIGAFILVLALLVPILNITFKLVNDPAKKAVQATDQKDAIVGFTDIPPYPGSEFVYESNKEQQEVKDFLTSGRSVYRIPVGHDFQEVVGFYKETLQKNGWKHIKSVPLESETNMQGEYFINKKEGLRIYSQLNDIWYQKLTLNEAKTALADNVKAQKERELVLSTVSGTDLLPNLTWELRVPPEYLVRYYDVPVNKNLKAIKFQKLNSKEIVFLEPLFENDGRDPKIISDEFIEKYNQKIDDQVKEEKDEKIRIDLLDQKLVHSEIQFLLNTRENYYYLLVSNISSNPFINYIADNIKVKDQNMRPLESFDN